MSDNLPPLPEWTTRDDLGGLVPSEVRTAMRSYAAACVAAAVPPGWTVVPVEPTWDMKIAASTAYREAHDGHYTARMMQAADCWAAMLAAAPEVPR